MAKKIQIRRDLDAARQGLVLDNGEPFYATDTKKIWIGDGETPGGVEIALTPEEIAILYPGREGENYRIATDGTLQLKHEGTGLWHPITIVGDENEETLVIGPGES